MPYLPKSIEWFKPILWLRVTVFHPTFVGGGPGKIEIEGNYRAKVGEVA